MFIVPTHEKVRWLTGLPVWTHRLDSSVYLGLERFCTLLHTVWKGKFTCMAKSWFGAEETFIIIISVNQCSLIFLWKLWYILCFRILSWRESPKEHLFEAETFCNNKNVFSVTFNTSFQKKKKNILTTFYILHYKL